jgi:hypothetical protein
MDSCDALASTGTLTADVGLQCPVLFPQVRDDIGLITLEPATQGSDQQLKRLHRRSLRDCQSIQLWDTTRWSAANGLKEK